MDNQSKRHHDYRTVVVALEAQVALVLDQVVDQALIVIHRTLKEVQRNDYFRC